MELVHRYAVVEILKHRVAGAMKWTNFAIPQALRFFRRKTS